MLGQIQRSLSRPAKPIYFGDRFVAVYVEPPHPNPSERDRIRSKLQKCTVDPDNLTGHGDFFALSYDGTGSVACWTTPELPITEWQDTKRGLYHEEEALDNKPAWSPAEQARSRGINNQLEVLGATLAAWDRLKTLATELTNRPTTPRTSMWNSRQKPTHPGFRFRIITDEAANMDDCIQALAREAAQDHVSVSKAPLIGI